MRYRICRWHCGREARLALVWGSTRVVMAADDDYVPISCGDYEAFEIACMDGYDLELTTRDGRKVAGKAVGLAVRPPAEFLVISHQDGTIEDIRVDQVRYMAVLSRPRRFDDHTFCVTDMRPVRKRCAE